MDLTWELEPDDGGVSGVVDGRAFEITSWPDQASISFGGWGLGCRARERAIDAPAVCDGWGSTDPAADIVVFRGSAPSSMPALAVVEETGERTDCVVLGREPKRNFWIGFGRNNGSPKELVAVLGGGTDQALLSMRAPTSEELERQERQARARRRDVIANASWRPGALPEPGDDWDLVTVSPGEVNSESTNFVHVAFTFRRRRPAAYLHVYVEWMDEWPEFADWCHYFDASPLSRSIYELSLVGLTDAAASEEFHAWAQRPSRITDRDPSGEDGEHEADDEIPATGTALIDGVDRVVHRWDLGSVSYAGVEWSSILSVEVVAAGIDVGSAIGSLRSASSDELAEFVAAHDRERNWNPDWWTEGKA